AEVVLAELPRRVAEWLEQLGDRRVLRLQADRRARYADLGKAGAEAALPGDEGRTARRAALLPVGVGKHHPFLCKPVDVRRLITHQSVRVAAQVRDTDIVAPDDENVWFLLLLLCHTTPYDVNYEPVLVLMNVIDHQDFPDN